MTVRATFLLHPLGSHAGFWDLVYPGGLPHGYVALDLPGHGSRPSPAKQPPDIGSFSADVATEIRSIREASADAVIGAVGVSLGGLVAQHLAVAEPGLLDWVALVDTVPVYPEGMREMWRSRAAEVPETGASAYLEATLQTWFTEAFLQSTPGEDASEHVRAALAAIDPEGYRAACQILEVTDLAGHLGKVDVPALVLCGEGEGPAFTGAVSTFERSLSRCEVGWLSGKHAAAIEDRATFARLIAEFASRQRRTDVPHLPEEET